MTFSNEEKTIIGHIREMDRLPGPNCLANIWEKISPDVRINFKNKAGGGVAGQVFMNKELVDKVEMQSFDKHLTSTILLIIDLFDRLEKEKFILTFNPDQKHWVLGSDHLETEGVEITVDIVIRTQLLALIRKEFRVSQSLHALADNDYLSDEALRFQETMKKERRTLRFTQAALILSVLAQIPAWVQLFNDEAAKVELIPASQVQVSNLEEAPRQAQEIPIEPTDTVSGKGKSIEAPVPPPKPKPARSTTDSTTTASNETVIVEGEA